MLWKRCIAIGAALAAAMVPAAAQESPWAVVVHGYNALDPVPGFTDPQKALGKPVGGGVYAPDQSHVYSIGRPGADPGSYIILGFAAPIENHPDNPDGLDFIIYTNGFWVGGDPGRRWVEPALVQVSEDANGNGLPDDRWYTIPGSRNLGPDVLPSGIPNPSPPLAGYVLNPLSDGREYDWGYAGMSPTVQEYLDNFMRPDDPYKVGVSQGSGGGDAFDIAWALDERGIAVGLSKVHFIRLSAFVSGAAGPFGAITPEVVAAAATARDVDTDGDGILDDYETRVAGTDPARPESTVLPLERPLEYGGSPAGALLGTVADTNGNALSLYSDGVRTGLRDFNCSVDIVQAEPVPSGSLPDGLIASGAACAFQSSSADLAVAQVQPGQFTLAYASADIAGLDESALEPLRYDGAAFTRDSISGTVRDPGQNRATFLSDRPGIFLLASTAGTGDTNPGFTSILLNAAPPDGVEADGIAEVTLEAAPFVMPDGNPASPGTMFNLTVFPDTLATIITPDADSNTPGRQIQVGQDGSLSATLRAGIQAGQATFTLAHPNGTASGALPYRFRPGAAVGPVSMEPLNPQATAPGPIYFTTAIISDRHGNPLDDGTALTLEVIGGVCITPDTDSGAPGHQLAISQGRLAFTLLADVDDKNAETTVIYLRLYQDPDQSILIGEGMYIFEIVPMPLNLSLYLGLFAFPACAMFLFKRRANREDLRP